MVSLQRIKDFHGISVVCKSMDNGKLLFIRRNIQYFVSTAMLNVAFKAKVNGRDHDQLSRYKWTIEFTFADASKLLAIAFLKLVLLIL